MNQFRPIFEPRKPRNEIPNHYNLNDELSSKIREKAEKEGKSLNRTIKELLAQALHLTPEKKKESDDFREFLGIWEEKEFHEFQDNIEGFNQVDQEDWQ